MLYHVAFLEDIEAITHTDALLFALVKIHDVSRADSNFIVFCGNDYAFNCSGLGRIAGVGKGRRRGYKWRYQIARLNGVEGVEDTDEGYGRLHIFHDGRTDRSHRRSQKLLRDGLGDFRQGPHNGELHARLQVFVFSRVNDDPVSRCDMLPFFKRVKDRCQRCWCGSDVASTFHNAWMDPCCCRLGCRHTELGSGRTTIGHTNEQ
jgi:hypothetical protein